MKDSAAFFLFGDLMAQRAFKFNIDKNSKINRTPEGFLDVEAACARTGIQIYSDAGNTIREYRSPEEVFSKDSMDSHKLSPVTFHHPKVMVTDKNFKDHFVGITGENPKSEGKFLLNRFRIMDGPTIDEVLKRRDQGKSIEVSMGYACDVIPQEGKDPDTGEIFDAIQTGIRINHAALVDFGRGGPDVKLRLDSEELFSILLDREANRKLQTIVISKKRAGTKKEATTIAKKFGEIKKIEETSESFRFRQREKGLFKEKSFKSFPVPQQEGVTLIFATLKGRQDQMAKFKRDGIRIGDFYSADAIDMEHGDDSAVLVNHLAKKLDEAETALSKRDERFDNLKKETDELKAKGDELEQKGKELQTKVDSLSNIDSDEVQSMLARQKIVLDAAKFYKVDVKGKSEKEIKLAVITTHADKKDHDFSKESENYIDARFDLIIEGLPKEKEDIDKSINALGEFRKNTHDTSKVTDLSQKRQDYHDRQQNAWKLKSAVGQAEAKHAAK